MAEDKKTNDKPKRPEQVRLICKELEEATNRFIMKIEELEKLLPRIDE